MSAHLTAISRKVASAPARWLDAHGLLIGRMLDYGCGRGRDSWTYGMERYDPYYQPLAVMGRFDTITCTYVLNVIESAETREVVIQCLRDKLRKHGVAYITVRNDKAALKGTTRKGTWQGHVVLDLPIEYKCSGYIIYRMDASNDL